MNKILIGAIGLIGLAYLSTKKAKPSVNITATDFPTPTIPTGTYNTVDIDIIWTNIGEQSGSFIPKVSVSGCSPIDLGAGTITLIPTATYRKIARLTGVPYGSQTICPVPN